VRWVFAKDASLAVGDDAAWVDEISLVLYPQITSGPESWLQPAGPAVSFSATAEGTPPLWYQWRHNGNAIPGATNPVLVLPSTAISNAGYYQFEVANTASSASASGTLTLYQLGFSNGLAQVVAASGWGRQAKIEFVDELGTNTTWNLLTNLAFEAEPISVTDTSSATRTNRTYRLQLLP
jgi:hypothetical protein